MSDDDSLNQRFWKFCVEPLRISKLLRKAQYLCIAHNIDAFCSGEDLLHNVLIEAASKLQPDKTDGEWEAWLFTLLGRRAKDQKKRPVNQNILSAGNLSDEPVEGDLSHVRQAKLASDENPSPAESIESADQVQLVLEALKRMPKASEREALQLYYFTYNDDPARSKKVAAAMRVTDANARKILERARDSFKSQLQKITIENH